MDPLTAIAIGLAISSVVGGVASNQMAVKAQKKAQNQQLKAIQSRSEQIDKYGDEAAKVHQDSLKKLTPEALQETGDKAASDRRAIGDALVDGVADAGAQDLFAAQGGSSVVRDSYGRAVSDAVSAGRREASRLADMRRFGDVLFNTGINTNRAGQRIGQLGSFAQGATAGLDRELGAIAPDTSLASLLGALSGVAGIAAPRIGGGAAPNYGTNQAQRHGH